MTALNNRKDIKTARDPALRVVSWVRWGLILFIGALVLFAALLWLGRKTVAEAALGAWCTDRNLVCEADFAELGPGGATLKDVKVRSGGAVPFEASDVRANIEWPRLFTPSVKSVSVTSPTLRGTLSSQKLAFYGLEDLAKPSGGSNTAPALSIRDGRVFLMTDIGELAATVTMDGAFPREGVLQANIDPTNLTGPSGQITWSEGVIDLTAKAGRIDGRVQIDLARANVEGVTIETARFDASLEAPQSGAGETNLVWTGAIAKGVFNKASLENVTTKGTARFTSVPDLSVDKALGALSDLVFSAETGPVRRGDYAAESVTIEANLTSDDTAELSGPIGIEAMAILAPQGRVQAINTIGNARLTADSALDFDGKLTLDNIALTPGTARKLTAPIKFPGVLSAHGEAAQAALRNATKRFDAASDITLSRSAEGLTFTANRASVVNAASGLKTSITPKNDAPWLSYADGITTVTGDMALQGGGAPSVFIALNAFTQGNGALSIDAGSVKLKPWLAGGRKVSADLNTLKLTRSSDAFTLTSRGLATLSGKVSGTDLKTTQISGGVSASKKANRWSVAALGKKCLDLSTEGFDFGAIIVGAVRLDVCPQDGQFMRYQGKSPTGSVALGRLSVPFNSKSGAGVLNLSNAAVDWSSQGGLSMTVLADTLSLPLTIGERTLSIKSASPRLGVGTGQGAPIITARLGETAFGGTLIPARLTASEFSFDGRSGDGGISGAIRVPDLLIEDFRDDPLYQPLTADITAKLDRGQMDITGPLKLKRGGITIGDIASGIDVVRLNGAARVNLRPLAFKPGGLQPLMLSDRLRGVLTDATGTLGGHALLNIQSGKLSGTGKTTLTNFGFQTQRLGRVERINTELNFTNLLDLTTARSQVATLGSVSVGIPLRDGRIVYYLDKGKFFGIESAQFPLAGGNFSLEPNKATKEPLGWNLGGARQSFEVSVEDLELDRLIELLKLPDTRATGTVSGRFPIIFEDNKVLIDNAVLKADEKGGKLAYTGDALDSTSVSDQGAQFAFQALRDLDFKVLEISIDGDLTDRVQAGAHIVGSNVRPLAMGQRATLGSGQAFEFNINLDSQLARLLNSGQYATQQQRLIDAAVEIIRDDQNKKKSE